MPYIILIAVILVVSFILAWRAAKRIEGGEGSDITEGVLLSISLPRENERLPVAAEQMFASLHGLIAFSPDVQEHISLEMASSDEGIKFYAFTPRKFKNFVQSQIYAQYPDAEIRESIDYTKSIPAGSFVSSVEVILARDFIFPIKTFRDFEEVDPLSAITSALEDVNQGEQLWLQLLVRPVGDFWQERGHEYVEMVREGISPVTLNPEDIVIDVGKSVLSLGGNVVTHIMRGPQPPPEPPRPGMTVRLSAGQELTLKMIENKLSKIGFETKMRLVSMAANRERAEDLLSGLVSSLKQYSTANVNSFEPDPESPSPDVLVKDYQSRVFTEKEAGHFVLTTEELASIFHLPNVTVQTPSIAWTGAKKGEPPINLPTSGATVIGETVFRDVKARFGIKKADRRKHVYVVGKTGTGKSTLLKNMIIQDMRAGEGVAVLDPHGQLIDELLDYVPQDRVNDVVLFNPADSDNPVSLNMLEMVDQKQRTLMGDTLVDVFKKYFAESWGPRLEYILKNCILTLLEVPNTSLLSIIRLLVDRDYRRYIVGLIKDPQMKSFWNVEFAKMERNERLVTEAISPIQNKVGQFLNSELIRNIVGQPRSTLRLDEIINTGKIFFVNLASGRIGANNTALLGAMIVSQLQFAAMRRVDIPEDQRRDFYLYADEFQNFATESFATVLSEARKYRLDLTLTHQYIEQMPEPVQEAVFGNVGTLICFTVGPNDARFLEREFTPTFLENDLINLGRYEMYMKLQIDDTQSNPFSAKSLPPMQQPASSVREAAITTSRNSYGKPVERIEKMIKKWTETKFRPGQPPEPPAWALQEVQRVGEAPVEGQQKKETGFEQPVSVVASQSGQSGQRPPRPFVSENIPGIAERASSGEAPTLSPEKDQQTQEAGSDVEIFRFPQVQTGKPGPSENKEKQEKSVPDKHSDNRPETPDVPFSQTTEKSNPGQ